MSPEVSPQRHSSKTRSLWYLVQRWVLRRPFLLARSPGQNLRFKVKTEDVVGRHLYKYQVHEPVLSAFLVDYLKFEPGDVVLDIGANIGWYSLLLERRIPAGVDIFAFEPDPLNFELLQHNLRINQAGRVTAVQKALAEEEGVQLLHRYGNSNLGRHSLLQLQDGDAVEVKTTSVDRFWDEMELGSRTPRFIKIDIEGYELLALRGATRVLERCPALLCEFSPGYMRQGGLDPADLVALLTGHGFLPHAVSQSGLKPVDPGVLPALERVADFFWLKTPAAV